MLTVSFPEFLQSALQQGPTNIIFEFGMYSLYEDLQNLLLVFKAAGVPFEIIGGVAVNAHLVAASAEDTMFVTRDVDVLIRREDLAVLRAAAVSMGYEPKRRTGGYALLLPNRTLKQAVRLLFVGEKSRSTYPVTTPGLNPVSRQLFGIQLPVAPVVDLLITKLNSLRTKDLVHLEVLDQAGLITPEIEQLLPVVLRERLQSARAQFETETLLDDDNPDAQS